MSASLIGLVHPVIFFPLYEKIKIWMMQNLEPTGTEKLSVLNTMVCTTISKTLASLVTYPHEIFRSRLMYERADVWLY